MSCDPLLLELALAWQHLPSGAAVVQGIVRHPDGGPIVAGAALRERPVGAGGAEVLFAGADPDRHQFAPDPATWAVTGPQAVQAELERRGWRVITRAEAASILHRQSYRLRAATAPGHALHLDHADQATWHAKVGPTGAATRFTVAAFVVRPLQAPDTPADLAATTAEGATPEDTTAIEE